MTQLNFTPDEAAEVLAALLARQTTVAYPSASHRCCATAIAKVQALIVAQQQERQKKGPEE